MKRVLIPKGGMNEDHFMDLRGMYKVIQETMTEMVLLVPDNEAATVAASYGGLFQMDE